jgi:hypothetical protein
MSGTMTSKTCSACGEPDTTGGAQCARCGAPFAAGPEVPMGGAAAIAQPEPLAGAAHVAAQVQPRQVTIWLLASGLLMALGGVGPWAKAFGVSIGGTDGGDGWFLIVGGLAAAAVAGRRLASPRGRRGLIGFAVVGVVCVVVTIIDLADIGSMADGTAFGSVIDAGWGIYLSLIASLSLLAATVVAFIQQRR